MQIFRLFSALLKICVFGIFLFISVSLYAQNTFTNYNIKSFAVKQNQVNSQKLTVFALDTLTKTNKKIKGNYVFTVNGLSQSLLFNNGEAVLNLPLKKSSFLYVKFDNEINNPSNLYYVYKTDSSLTPFKVNLFWLLVIPIGLILIGYMFKKIIGLAIFFTSVYFYFNHSSGLSMGIILQTIFDGLKSIF